MDQEILECQLRAWTRKPALRMLYVEWFAFFAYPATGGFNGKKFLPEKIIRILHRMEDLFASFSGLLAFRTFVVIQRNV